MGDLNELARSIAEVGVIEPLIVAVRGVRFEVVAGHRRFIAAKIARLVVVPCVVHHSFKVAEEAVMLHENNYREDMNPVDEAVFFNRILAKVDGDTDRLAELVHERRSYVEERLQLLRGDELVREALKRGEIAIGVAQELNLYQHEPTRRAHLQVAIEGGAKVHMVRAWRKEANRFHELQQTRDPALDAAPAEPVPVVAYNPFKCFFCASEEFVETMEQIYIHRPCKTLLKRALERVAPE